MIRHIGKCGKDMIEETIEAFKKKLNKLDKKSHTLWCQLNFIKMNIYSKVKVRLFAG